MVDRQGAHPQQRGSAGQGPGPGPRGRRGALRQLARRVPPHFDRRPARAAYRAVWTRAEHNRPTSNSKPSTPNERRTHAPTNSPATRPNPRLRRSTGDARRHRLLVGRRQEGNDAHQGADRERDAHAQARGVRQAARGLQDRPGEDGREAGGQGGPKEGKALPASDTNDSASCFYSGLDDEDVKDLQYRSLTVSLKRFASDPTLGSGEKRAQAFLAQQTTKATTSDGAKNAKTEKTSGIGDEASTVTADSKKDDNDFKNVTVVARTANVVITVKYSGAGYEGAKSPEVGDMTKDAQGATKDAVTSVGDANKK
ncbi:hypothetical protein ACQEVX_16410 [Streptomyces syringium]|uniref:hypothetical protein n=1 Tax=Streptomyces syringium TaxID=76729 RepID=UPI003D8CFCBF